MRHAFSTSPWGLSRGLLAFIFPLALIPQAQAQALSNLPLAAHRAIYDLSLLKSTGDSAPASARGRIVFEFTGSACEGYAASFRQLTEVQSQEGDTSRSDMRSATFEDGDSQSFNFKVETVNNGRGADAVDGRAMKSKDGALSLDLRSPKRAKLDLDHRVVFPTEQILRIIEAAKQEKRTLDMKVFDGSDDGRKIFSTLTLIGKEAANPPEEKAAQIKALETVRRWPVKVSYFDLAKKENNPDYIMSFDLFENGISGALKLDYGNFILKAEMTGLELLPQSDCQK